MTPTEALAELIKVERARDAFGYGVEDLMDCDNEIIVALFETRVQELREIITGGTA